MIKNIIKRNGKIEPFLASKANGWGEWAAKKLGNTIDWGSIVIDAVNKCPETCTSVQLQRWLIESCLERKTWEHNKMAGRLYSSLMDREIFDGKIPTVKQYTLSIH